MEQEKRYIYQVYKEGSFSKAAQSLFVTQPALSLAVKRVETQLGAEIFDRSKRPLELTQAGEVYIDAVERIQRLEEELSCQITDLKTVRKGKVHIGGTHFVNTCVLPEVLPAFARHYPGIELELEEGSSVDMANALRQWEMDLTFSCDPGVICTYEHRACFVDHVILAVPQDLPLAPELKKWALSPSQIKAGEHLQEERAISLSAFKDLPFVLLRPGNNLYDRGRQLFEEAGTSPSPRLSIGQMVTAYRLAEAGLGATFVSDRQVFSGGDRLLFFPLDSPLASRVFYILLARRSYTPFAVKAFVDFAVKRIREVDLEQGRDWPLPEE